jgi:competence protein ComEA
VIRYIVMLVTLGLVGDTIAAPVNINSADAATLARELKGIGMKRAQAIVEYRSHHGPFKSPDELVLVKGIGPAAIARNRADLRVELRATGANAAGAAKPTGSH